MLRCTRVMNTAKRDDGIAAQLNQLGLSAQRLVT